MKKSKVQIKGAINNYIKLISIKTITTKIENVSREIKKHIYIENFLNNYNKIEYVSNNASRDISILRISLGKCRGKYRVVIEIQCKLHRFYIEINIEYVYIE